MFVYPLNNNYHYFQVFNLSERRYDISKLNHQVSFMFLWRKFIQWNNLFLGTPGLLLLLSWVNKGREIYSFWKERSSTDTIFNRHIFIEVELAIIIVFANFNFLRCNLKYFQMVIHPVINYILLDVEIKTSDCKQGFSCTRHIDSGKQDYTLVTNDTAKWEIISNLPQIMWGIVLLASSRTVLG